MSLNLPHYFTDAQATCSLVERRPGAGGVFLDELLLGRMESIKESLFSARSGAWVAFLPSAA